MADKFTSEKRSSIMRAVKSSSTRPEKIVRSLIHRAGYRFRLHGADLPGRPDLVFRGRRKVIFVHGCFWHSHPDPACNRARIPKSRTDYWTAKLAANSTRDRKVVARLAEAGWESLILWECEIRDASNVLARVKAFLDSAR